MAEDQNKQPIEQTTKLVQDLITKYKKNFNPNVFEIYKWDLIKKYKGKPDINAKDFTEEIKSIKFSNIVYQLGGAVSIHIAREKSEEYRACFKVLFDENKPLNERVKYFNEETLKIYRSLESDKKKSHHQDERTIAAFLTYHDPDKYTFYKDSFYQKYCNYLGVAPKPKNEKYAHYLELIENLTAYIEKDQELISLVTDLTKESFPDYSGPLFLDTKKCYICVNETGAKNELSKTFPGIKI